MEMQIDKASYRALVEAAVQTLSTFSIGFAIPTKAPHGEIDAVSGGSGTLVAIEKFQGILTASHVIRELRKHESVGLILVSPIKTELHNLSFKMEMARDYSFSPQGDVSDGPDIGFLVPPPDVLGALNARMSFFNLSIRRTSMLERPQPIENGFWILSGIVGERTSDSSPEQGLSKIKIFRGMHGAGIVTKEFKRDGFDYLTFEALYNEFYEGPESYGGFSGGGLWQMLVKPDGEMLKISEFLLSGVAFYETAIRRNANMEKIREIICHGRASIYWSVVENIRKETSNTSL